MTRMEVVFVGVDADTTEPMVLLRDHPGRLCLPVMVDWEVAGAVLAARSGQPDSRPDGHALLVAVVASLNTRVDHVRIFRAWRCSPGAELVLATGARVAAHPGDAVAVALLAGTPIEVAPTALASALPVAAFRTADDEPHPALESPDPVEREVEVLHQWLAEAGPDDFTAS